MMHHRVLFLRLIILVSVVFQIGCSKTEVKQTVVRKITIQIDNSESMAGYLSKDSEFKDIVSGLETKIEKIKDSGRDSTLKILHTEYKTDSIKFKSGSEFNEAITSSNISIGNSSLLDKSLLGLIKGMPLSIESSSADSVDISFYITDFIPSFDAKDIREDKEKNKNNIKVLKNRMADVFNEARKRKLNTTIFRFVSKYNGTYFDYRNDARQYNGERPFFVIAIGHASVMDKILLQLVQSNWKSAQQLTFFDSEVKYEILQKCMKQGAWYTEGNKRIYDIESVKGKPVKFVLALKLPSLIDTSFISMRNFHSELKGGVIKINRLLNFNEFITVLDKNERKERGISSYSHFAEIQLDEVNLQESELIIASKMITPGWVIESSCSDDTDMGTFSQKTFGFQSMVEGIMESYAINSNYFEIRIKTQKG